MITTCVSMTSRSLAATPPPTYVCRECGGQVKTVLIEDNPGSHVYQFICRTCHREYGEPWVRHHHGISESPSRLDLERS